MLQEEKRKQLDAIVQRMVANKESDENIQSVVVDFKQKYAQTTQTESKNKLPMIDRAINTGAKVTDAIFGGGKIGEALAGVDVSGKELAGSALQSASLFFPAGRAAKIGTQAARYLGMRGASKAVGAISSGALGGYGFDVATNLQQEKEGTDILTPGIGAAIGGGIPAVGTAASGAKKLVVKFGEDQGSRVINSLIKPLLKDFSYGKNPGRAVAEEGIIANNFDDLEKAIRTRRQEVGQEIGELGRTISTKPEIQVRESLSVLDDAMKEAASLNNPTLLQRLQQVKRAITDNLVPELDETGNIVIKSAGARNLDNLTFEEARRVLAEIGDMTQFTGNPSDDKLVNSTLKRIYGSIKQATLDNARKTNPELAKRFEELTEKYADLSSAEIATKYRDKILERQNLVGLNPKMTGIASGLVTLIATGGATAPAVLVGIGGAALDNLMSSPGFKTRLAAMLSKKTAGELDTIFSKVPALKKVFPKDEIQFPGDVLFDKVDDAIKDIPNKQGGFFAVPNLGRKADDIVTSAKNNLEEIALRIDNTDKSIMEQFSNAVFTDNKRNVEVGLASKAQRLAETMGLDAAYLSNKELAEVFNDILEIARKTRARIVPITTK